LKYDSIVETPENNLTWNTRKWKHKKSTTSQSWNNLKSARASDDRDEPRSEGSTSGQRKKKRTLNKKTTHKLLIIITTTTT